MRFKKENNNFLFHFITKVILTFIPPLLLNNVSIYETKINRNKVNSFLWKTRRITKMKTTKKVSRKSMYEMKKKREELHV